MLVYGSYIHRGPKSGCKMVTLFDSYSYDGVSVAIWVMHAYIHVCLYKFELTVAHLCSITACGMKSFGGLRGEIPCFLGRERQGAQTGEKTIEIDNKRGKKTFK